MLCLCDFRERERVCVWVCGCASVRNEGTVSSSKELIRYKGIVNAICHTRSRQMLLAPVPPPARAGPIRVVLCRLNYPFSLLTQLHLAEVIQSENVHICSKTTESHKHALVAV